jgi:hypothetical protein
MEEMRNKLARKEKHPMQISPAAEFSSLVVSGFRLLVFIGNLEVITSM